MPLPKAPIPGMVVRYSFLWSSEAAVGETEGRKDCPCVVVTAVRGTADGRFRVRCCRSRMSPPRRRAASRSLRGSSGILGSTTTPRGSYSTKSTNSSWPGVDLRPVSRVKPGVWTFGVLPTELFGEITAKLRSILDQRRTLRAE